MTELAAEMEIEYPATDTWMKKTDMPTARAGLSTSVVDALSTDLLYRIAYPDVRKFPS